jgi:hypothetical protein
MKRQQGLSKRRNELNRSEDNYATKNIIIEELDLTKADDSSRRGGVVPAFILRNYQNSLNKHGFVVDNNMRIRQSDRTNYMRRSSISQKSLTCPQ